MKGELDGGVPHPADVGMIIVLLAVSFIAYLIFFVIPGGDPALSDRGQGGDAGEHRRHPTKARARPEHLRAVVRHGEALLSGKLVSYYDGTNVVQQIKEGMPETFSLCIGAGMIWLGFGVLVGTISAVTAGGPRTGDHRACPDRDLAARRLAGTVLLYLFAGRTGGGRGSPPAATCP